MLCDRIVCGITTATLERRLLEFTFEKAVDMAQVWETTDSDIQELQKSSKTSTAVHKVATY